MTHSNLTGGHGHSHDIYTFPGQPEAGGDGIVRAVQADPDYTYRPEPETTLEALRKVVDG